MQQRPDEEGTARVFSSPTKWPAQPSCPLDREENQYLAVPPAVARHLPEKLQSLIGYSMGGYALGYFGNIQHPKEALKE